jgi:hypothetical protein
MFESGDRLYFIDIMDGTVQEGKFIEQNSDGSWIRLKGYSVNTFVYADTAGERIFKDMGSAQDGLANLKAKIKERLLIGNRFVEEIPTKLQEEHGRFYADIVREILHALATGR